MPKFMQETDVQNIADQLLTARRSRLLQDAVDTAAVDIANVPRVIDDAYQIQSAVVARVGAVGGWKTGADSASAVPIAAPIFADDIYDSGTSLAPGTMRLMGLEAEIAFRLGSDLPPRSHAYSEKEFLDAVETMVPLIELVDSRLQDFEAAGSIWKLADNQINSGLVIGEPVLNWQQLDFSALRAILKVDHQIIRDNRGWNYPDTPAGLATRFVNTFSEHCGGIRAGQIITTGSLTGIDFIDTGATVTAELENIGSVQVKLAV